MKKIWGYKSKYAIIIEGNNINWKRIYKYIQETENLSINPCAYPLSYKLEAMLINSPKQKTQVNGYTEWGDGWHHKRKKSRTK